MSENVVKKFIGSLTLFTLSTVALAQSTPPGSTSSGPVSITIEILNPTNGATFSRQDAVGPDGLITRNAIIPLKAVAHVTVTGSPGAQISGTASVSETMLKVSSDGTMTATGSGVNQSGLPLEGTIDDTGSYKENFYTPSLNGGPWLVGVHGLGTYRATGTASASIGSNTATCTTTPFTGIPWINCEHTFYVNDPGSGGGAGGIDAFLKPSKTLDVLQKYFNSTFI
jgi:hypothetical protein